ncbi:mannitol dehydrogenase family protein [Catenovulum agarivorans]|uniref:mannitol dehydrogenase family protein n=1 Tax=Catenovulum agarivorans TaxID=1172192 RepID=UPI0002E2863F|nr:mannitol dehydrogenase family protein [Catenovulum agarivorans]
MRLNEQNLAAKLDSLPANVQVARYSRSATKIGIVHLGLGAFHRSHQALFTERAMNECGGDWAICAVSMRNETLQQQLSGQDNLFTVVMNDKDTDYQIVSAVKEVLVAKNQLDQVLARLTSADTKLVSLTVTEKGYCLNSAGDLDTELDAIKADLANPSAPTTVVGMLAYGLAQRHAAGTKPFHVVACDNLPGNGEKLKTAVVQFAKAANAELAEWIEQNVQFPNTMVDCITPHTEDKTVQLVKDDLGLEDLAPVNREAFHQWVIEDTLPAERPAWEKVGVIFTNDVEAFENTKLRILNGLHSILAYMGPLLGYKSVFEAVSDSRLKAFLQSIAAQEVIPTIEAPVGLDLHEYAAQIVRRFENPKICHLLEQIACDGTIKIPVRTLQPILDNLKAGRSNNNKLYYVVAAWLLFLVNKVETEQTINDPKAAQLHQIISNFTGDIAQDVKTFMTAEGLLPEAVRSNSEVINKVTEAYKVILQHRTDIRAALPM